MPELTQQKYMRPQMQVGQYVMDRPLGQGGMAEVWLAHHSVLAAPVAVKFLTSPWAGHPELEERFLREAKRQGALDHPNLVKVYGFEYFEGHSFLIMQYIDGESLDDRLVRGGRKPLDFGDVSQIASGALLGLGYAHERQIVHRDIKPSNIMLDRNLHAFIGDFGLVMVRDEKRMTRTGTLMGTPLYMSPEQILHPKDVDHRADIYSFGCVLYEMFAGSTPFESHDSDTDFHVKMAHTTRAPASLRQLNPAVPAPVEAVVMKCLEKIPDRRFQSCAEVRDALAAAMQPFASRATAIPLPASTAPPALGPAASARPPAWRRLLHKPAAIAAVSAVVVASLAGGSYVVITRHPFGKHDAGIVNPPPHPNPAPVVNRTPAIAPLHNVKFRVRLASLISSDAAEERQPVRGTVLAPAAYGTCAMDGVVTRAGRSRFISGRRKPALLFTFDALNCSDGTRGIDSHVVSFSNSRGQVSVDEEGHKIRITTAGGARAGTSLSGKRKVMSFAPGSVFVVQVSDRGEN